MQKLFFVAAAVAMASSSQAVAAGASAQSRAYALINSATNPGQNNSVTGAARAQSSALYSENIAGFTPVPIGATTAAYADLSTGKVGISGSSTNYATSFARANWDDEVIFSIPNASANSITPISFRISYEGLAQRGYNGAVVTNDYYGYITQYSQTQYPGQYQYSNQSAFQFGVDFYNGAPNGDFRRYSSGFLTTVYDGQGLNRSALVTFGLLGALSKVQFNIAMQGSSQHDASYDFSHTGSLVMTLPQGVTYTSASGNFLANTGAVPEPDTWALLIAGFGFAGVAMRRHRVVGPTVPFAHSVY